MRFFALASISIFGFFVFGLPADATSLDELSVDTTPEIVSAELAATRIITADQMSCARAIDTYEGKGRIYVIANGKDVVPLYGMTPVRRSQSLQCSGRSKMKLTYFVRTQDRRHCGIAVYCQP